MVVNAFNDHLEIMFVLVLIHTVAFVVKINDHSAMVNDKSLFVRYIFFSLSKYKFKFKYESSTNNIKSCLFS